MHHLRTIMSEITTDAETIEKVLLQCAADKKLSSDIAVEENPAGASLRIIGDGRLLSGSVKLRAEDENGKSCEYTALSIYLQIADPDQGLLAYRNICKQYNVNDPVKALDKKIVVSYFLGTAAEPLPAITAPAAESTTLPSQTAKAAVEEIGDKDVAKGKDERRHHHRERDDKDDKKRSDRDRDRSKDKDRREDRQKREEHKKRKERDQQPPPPESSPNKKVKSKKDTLITNEQLMEHLDVVVDKRKIDPEQHQKNQEQDDSADNVETEQENDMWMKKQYEGIRKALSADGFQLATSNDENATNKTIILPAHKERAAFILGNEIPVGNSASILRANNPRKDLSRVLELYMETVSAGSTSADKKGHSSKTTTQSSKATAALKSYLIGKKPVIVVPKGMTAPITVLNAHEFLANAKFVPRDQILKQQQQQGAKKVLPPTTFTRTVQGVHGRSSGSAGAGGGSSTLIEYEITDNPRKLLGPNPQEWERIVAVVVLGQSWQFKDWHKLYSTPATLFDNVYGFYISMEGDQEPADVAKWAVNRSYLNRDKRGLDRVTFASFWNRLDEWMRVYKPELFLAPSNQNNANAD